MQEELGFFLPVGRLLVVDWVPPRPHWSEGTMLVFEGACTVRSGLSRSGYQCWSYAGRGARLPRLRSAHPSRWLAALRAQTDATALDLEDGHPIV